MKRLMLVRHAETEWSAPTGKDFDRQLTPKGLRDARAMATMLRSAHFIPDRIFTSSAVRAIQTAHIFRDTLGLDNALVQSSDMLYEPSVNSFYNTVETIPNGVQTAFIFSHNPGISAFCNELDIGPMVNLAPCDVFALELNTERWDEISHTEKKFLFYRQAGRL